MSDDESLDLSLVFASVRENKPSLTALELRDLITNEDAAELVDSLEENTHVRELGLNIKALTVDASLNPFVELLRNRSSLECVTLEGCYNEPEDYSDVTAVLLDALGGNTHLKKLSLYYLNIVAFATNTFEDFLTKSSNLKALTIELDRYQSYREISVTKYERRIGVVSKTQFSLEHPDGALLDHIQRGLMNNSSLEDVTINYVDSDIANVFLSGLMNHPKLKMLCIERIDNTREIDPDLIRRFRETCSSTLAITERY